MYHDLRSALRGSLAIMPLTSVCLFCLHGVTPLIFVNAAFAACVCVVPLTSVNAAFAA